MKLLNNKRLSLSLAVFLLFFIAGEILIFGLTDIEEDKQFSEEFLSSYKVYSLVLPAKADFAGEETPMNRMDVRENLEREMLVNTYWQSSTLLMLKRANRWFPEIEPILKKNGVPDDFKYLALIESGFTLSVSPSGAAGFWQFLEKTGKEYNLEINDQIDERYHVQKSTEAACKYLKDAHAKLKSWTLVAAAFNMGLTGISDQAKNQKTKDYYNLSLNQETGRYVYRILALKTIHGNPANYGFKLRKKDLYPAIPTYAVSIDSAGVDLVDLAYKEGVSFKIVKLLNPWIKKTKLNASPDKPLKILFPEKSFSDKNGLMAQPEEFGFNGPIKGREGKLTEADHMVLNDSIPRL
jgi:membrane-bound lytic murein transglycosylase D